MTLNIAHRGHSSQYPENTLLAFERAIAVGADCIELDVVTTGDGVVVVSHDTRADRCTDGTGFLDEMTLAEVKQLDAGVTFGEQFTGLRIPTLHEALDLILVHNVRVCIEVKGRDLEDYLRNARAAVDVVQSRRVMYAVTMTAFNAECLRAIKGWEPMVATGLDPDHQDGTYTPWQMVQKVLVAGGNFLLHRHETLTPEIVNESHHHGLGLWTWTVNHEADMQRVMEMGVDAIMTDHPDVLGTI